MIAEACRNRLKNKQKSIGILSPPRRRQGAFGTSSRSDFPLREAQAYRHATLRLIETRDLDSIAAFPSAPLEQSFSNRESIRRRFSFFPLFLPQRTSTTTITTTTTSPS